MLVGHVIVRVSEQDHRTFVLGIVHAFGNIPDKPEDVHHDGEPWTEIDVRVFDIPILEWD
jgi:hypothetical protein